MEVKNRRWPDDQFLQLRQGVLARWPTGRDIDLDEAVDHQRRLPESKVYCRKLASTPKPLLRLSCGWATSEQTMAHMQAMEQAGIDVLNWEVDSYTRKHRFAESQRGLEQSLKLGKSMLNGYPFVVQGLKNCREVARCTSLPLMFNGNNDEEPMLLAEMGFAAGCTANTVHDLRDLITHAKTYPLDQRILNNQYVCKLAAYYTERGVPIIMWADGTFLYYCPPSVGTAIEVIECLTAAEQGVKHIGLVCELRGNLMQDIASIHAMKRLAREYLDRFGYKDVTLWTSTYSWGGAWPVAPNAASALLAWLATTSCLAGADHIQSKSIDEAVGITSSKASVKSVEIVKQIIHIVRHQALSPSPALTEERDEIETEARAILDRVLELGDGDPLVGEIKATEAGVIDAPFSSWVHIKGKVLPVRDRHGAFRFWNQGNLPFSEAIMAYNHAKIAERAKAESRAAGYEMLIEDIDWLSKDL